MLDFAPPTNLFWILADLLQVLAYLIIAEVIASWLVMFRKVSPRNAFVQALDKVTYPVLEPFRRALPPQKMGGLDISPMLAIIVIQVLENFLVRAGSFH